jgi:hypothetical protein
MILPPFDSAMNTAGTWMGPPAKDALPYNLHEDSLHIAVEPSYEVAHESVLSQCA